VLIRKKFEIKNKSGLHARPAALFVNATKKYKSNIKLKFLNKEVNGKSILAVLSLGIAKDGEVYIEIDGEDEKIALKAIEALFKNNFGEEE
jgi:phosphocarrier protein